LPPAYTSPRIQLLQRPDYFRFAVLSLRHHSRPPSAESYILPCGLRGAGQDRPASGRGSDTGSGKQSAREGPGNRQLKKKLSATRVLPDHHPLPDRTPWPPMNASGSYSDTSGRRFDPHFWQRNFASVELRYSAGTRRFFPQSRQVSVYTVGCCIRIAAHLSGQIGQSNEPFSPFTSR
jgi:hypothetical protein